MLVLLLLLKGAQLLHNVWLLQQVELLLLLLVVELMLGAAHLLLLVVELMLGAAHLLLLLRVGGILLMLL